jgi:uncharacterized membrane protein YraQ (UPF0718 family)
MTHAHPSEARKSNLALQVTIFVVLVVAGLLYVKWLPYYDRAFVAASKHAIGKSILMGDAAHAPAPSWDAALAYALAYGKAIWQAMVLGLLLGSAVQALLPVQWVSRLLGGRGFGSALAGGMLALPGMMCTCCAAPVVVGLRQRQAAPGAAIAFWLGNTVLNPATLVFMGFVLGWQWTGLRLLLGVPMVFGLGWLANRMTTPKEAEQAEASLAAIKAEPETAPFRRWLVHLGRMSLRLIPEYVVLVLLLGAARAWLFPVIGPQIGNELGWVLAFAVAGALFVIPTAGEVPIIQGMLSLGMGVGPAGALLMTLPPISLPSMAMLARSFPPRILAVVAATVVLFGVLAGGLAISLFYTPG